MITAYVIALVLGGGFLALSLFSDLLEGVGADLDVDGDLDVGGDLDLGGDLDADATVVEAGDADGGALKILSLRTFVYTLFGFGLVGVLLTWIWGPERAGTTAAFAGAGGLATGFTASLLFGLVKRSDSGARLGEESFIGLTGRMTLPMGATSPGRVSVFRGDRRVALRALPHPSADATDPESWSDVIVVDMDAGIAQVIPVDTSLELPPEN